MDEPVSRDAGTRPPRFRSATLLLAVAVLGALLWFVPRIAPVALASANAWLEATGRHVRELLLGDVRVGIQIGHLDAALHPEEHAWLRASTGAAVGDVTEVDINRAVAHALADILVQHGVQVDLLPATVPPRYRADALVALHADSNEDPDRRGYKSAHFEPARTPQERRLKAWIDASYLDATGLPDDHENVTGNMYRYYAFDPRYRYAVSPVTPSLLIEMGYISNRYDLATLAHPEVPARAIADGILAYLREVGRLPDP